MAIFSASQWIARLSRLEGVARAHAPMNGETGKVLRRRPSPAGAVDLDAGLVNDSAYLRFAAIGFRAGFDGANRPARQRSTAAALRMRGAAQSRIDSTTAPVVVDR
ncbi:MAG: hypothetical protein IIZ63_10005 [Caulobacteraceae bacterium]|nr:hypothetical protein [Caulobacteraceae bacterium]